MAAHRSGVRESILAQDDGDIRTLRLRCTLRITTFDNASTIINVNLDARGDRRVIQGCLGGRSIW
jgi:hypothetical protein